MPAQLMRTAIWSLAILWTSHIQAQDFRVSITADELLQHCQATITAIHDSSGELSHEDEVHSAYCAGFVEAAVDAGSFIGVVSSGGDSVMAHARQTVSNCAAPTVTGPQLIGIVVKFMLDHPESRDQGAATVCMLAIARAYPCSGQ